MQQLGETLPCFNPRRIPEFLLRSWWKTHKCLEPQLKSSFLGLYSSRFEELYRLQGFLFPVTMCSAFSTFYRETDPRKNSRVKGGETTELLSYACNLCTPLRPFRWRPCSWKTSTSDERCAKHINHSEPRPVLSHLIRIHSVFSSSSGNPDKYVISFTSNHDFHPVLWFGKFQGIKCNLLDVMFSAKR